MGKQAKKKEKIGAVNQKNHNRATKHSRTKRRPVVWSSAKDKDGKTRQILVQRNTQWDWGRTHDAVTMENGATKLIAKKPKPHLYEPYDRLMDDWADSLRGYAEYHKAKVEREPLDNGLFRYSVYVDWNDSSAPKGVSREILLVVESRKNLNFGSHRRRRKKRA